MVSHIRGRKQVEGVGYMALRRIFGPERDKVTGD
jgi:hypothetical protein